jgi:hypothetical protein
MILAGVTHFAAMFWLFVARMESAGGEKETWYDAWNLKEAMVYEVYIDAVFWAKATMTSIGYGDILPITNVEKLASLFIMIVGATTYAGLFGTFVVVIDGYYHEIRENQQLLEKTVRWAKLRNLSEANMAKILHYYNFARKTAGHINRYETFNNFPMSLKTEISMFIYEDLINNMTLFEVGDSSFIMGLVRYMKPRLYMKGDYVTRTGDLADFMFFIKSGKVEVLSADNDDVVIAIQDRGTFLGEIGLLLQDRRSVPVRALSTVSMAVVSNIAMLAVIGNYPEHREYLEKVAR